MKVEIDIQDIASAPKDRKIWVYEDEKPLFGDAPIGFVQAKWFPDIGAFRDDRGYRLWSPTHWVELPAPTEEKSTPKGFTLDQILKAYAKAHAKINEAPYHQEFVHGWTLGVNWLVQELKDPEGKA